MSSEAHPEGRRIGPLILVFVAVSFVLLAAAGLNGIRDLRAAYTRKARLEESIVKAEERIDILRNRVARLRDDPVELERLAREELGLVRQTDVVIVLPENGEPEPPLPPASNTVRP